MFRAPLLTGAVLAAALLVTACDPASRPAAGGGSTPAAPSSAPATAAPASGPAVPATTAPATTAPATAVPTTAASATGSPGAAGVVTPASCAAMTGRTFLLITRAAAAAGGALTVTGQRAKLVCGGPDDLSYDVAAGVTTTGRVLAGAPIVTFPLRTMAPAAISAGQLPGYVASHQSLGIFLVTGPLTGITGLREEYHP
jgi:hypothetical protein